MKIFGLTANWFKAPVVVVRAESFEEAVKIVGRNESHIVSPWNAVTAKTLWEEELKDSSLGAKIIAEYRLDEKTSHGLLELFRK